MLRVFVAFVTGAALAAALVWSLAGGLMFKEQASPFGMEETVARIQRNIQRTGKGWSLVGLRNPVKAIEQDGGNALPVLMVEACSTRYSGPILKKDALRMLSILMPCKISVYKKDDGKVYIGMMNAELVGGLFGADVAAIMHEVAADQASFVAFDPKEPAPPMIKGTPGGGSATGGAGAAAGGC